MFIAVKTCTHLLYKHLLFSNTPPTLILNACVCLVMFVSVLNAFEPSAAGAPVGWMHIGHADLSVN